MCGVVSAVSTIDDVIIILGELESFNDGYIWEYMIWVGLYKVFLQHGTPEHLEEVEA